MLISCHSTEKEEASALRVDVLKLAKPVDASLRGIAVLDEKQIWLSGSNGSILRSINGGLDWEVLSQPDGDSLDFRDLHVFSDSVALIVSAGYPSRIYKTRDAGKTWKLVHENSDSSAFMNSIAFVDDNSGVVLGDVLGSRHLFLRTTDAGESWNRIDSSFLPKPLSVENAFAASGTCIALNENGHYVACLGGEMVRCFYSEDGLNWTAHATEMFSGKNTRGAYSLAYGNGKFLAVGGDFLEVDSGRFPIFSEDGKTWEKTAGNLHGYRSVIDYSDHLQIWLSAGTNGLDCSLDQGETWIKADDTNLNALQFIPNTSKAIAANQNGEVFLLTIHPNR